MAHSANNTITATFSLFVMLHHLTLSAKVLCFGLCRPRSSVHSVVRPDRSFYHDIWWMAWAISMKLTRNIIHYPLLMTWLDFGGQRSRSQLAVVKASTSTSDIEVCLLVKLAFFLVSWCWHRRAGV